MNFNELKRKSFFWLDRLQVSRKERIGIALLLAILAVILSTTLLLEKKVVYQQHDYEALKTEFEKRSSALEQEQNELRQKYTPPAKVNEPKPAGAPGEVKPAQIVNINEATLEELKTLNGIGDTYAKRIIEYRETHGGFKSVEELRKVKGIGEKRLEKIKPFIKL